MVGRKRRPVGGTELRVSSPYRSGGAGRALTVIVCIVVDIGLAWLGLAWIQGLDGFCGIGRAL